MTVDYHLNLFLEKISDQPLICRHLKQELLPENESGTVIGLFQYLNPIEATTFMGPDFSKVTAMETSDWPD